MKEITIDILPNGEIRYTRCDEKTNESLIKILTELAPDKKEEIQKFLDGAKQIEVIIGSESLCG